MRELLLNPRDVYLDGLPARGVQVGQHLVLLLQPLLVDIVEVEGVVVVNVVASVLWRLGLMRWGEADIKTMLQGYDLGLPHCQSRARGVLIYAGSEHIFLHQLLQLIYIYPVPAGVDHQETRARLLLRLMAGKHREVSLHTIRIIT